MFTKKELEVLELRKKGLKQSDIATKLKISQPAVSSFEKNALKKIRSAHKIMNKVKELKIDYDLEE